MNVLIKFQTVTDNFLFFPVLYKVLWNAYLCVVLYRRIFLALFVPVFIWTLLLHQILIIIELLEENITRFRWQEM